MVNFTWWVNRKDVRGKHLFSGGFLGLDNIGIFDRSKPLPTGGHLEQADGTAWMAFYCVIMLAMALELAPHNIRVNCVAPGAVAGDRIDRVIAGQAAARGIPLEQMRAQMLERAPLRRMVTADDIVAATLFLCSDMAHNISGQVLAVNAGEPAG